LIVASASASFKLDDIVIALKGLYGQAISMHTPVTSLPNFEILQEHLQVLVRCIQRVQTPRAYVAHSAVTVIRSDILNILVERS
jgi:hypothetical protein